ncbi:FAD-dependent oxidoreductase [Pseudomonas sp. C32]|jgi:hypothetical protein|uniref:FAD-dependent oxidoreductase n=1 Tax=Pseudomonas sp. C32 TaxID=1529208 RepID=UPI0026207275|nr:FAD-dependent oxidoreductase [Pseudomonas sp. C32]MDN4546967.1 FAD-dependent oxidoreductase [Pseudomonas sp. C32]
MANQFVNEPARTTQLFGEYDVVVLGGGPGGIAAATAASIQGASVLLVERYGFLGGMGTAAGVSNFCGLYANHFGEPKRVVHGVASRLLERMDEMRGLKEPHLIFGKILAQAFDTAAYKIAADELLLSNGVKLLFHALAADVTLSDQGQIESLILETKSGRRAVRAKLFIDGSGDGDMAAWAGASVLTDSPGSMMYPSTMFRINDVPAELAQNRGWDKFPELMAAEEMRSGKHFPRKGPIIRPQNHSIEWRANLTQVANPDGTPVNGIDAEQLSYAEVEGRRQIQMSFEMMRAAIPEFKNSYIVDIPPQVGIRETRRIEGDYVLTDDDVLSCASFEDTIGVNSWPVEDHVQGDVIWRWPDLPNVRGFNQLPYRMLLPKGINNLFVIGRCASMSHTAQSAARVTGACFVMGEAAGTAAAICAKEGLTPRQIDVPRLQQILQKNGAYLG